MRDQWGMSNVLKVSLQATIYSLHGRGWSRRRIARELGSIERPLDGICGWQNQPFRPPGLKEPVLGLFGSDDAVHAGYARQLARIDREQFGRLIPFG